jgi:hypothetical protein
MKERNEMKLQMSMTQEEKDKVLNMLYQSPCRVVNCRGIPCEACPLKGIVEEYNSIAGKFAEQIIKMPTEETKDA